MPTRSRYRAGVLEYFDSATHERVLPLAPVVFYDDFIGLDGFFIDETGSSGAWTTVTVLQNTAIAVVADGQNGVVQITLDADVNAEDGVISFGDQRNFNAKAGLVWEARVNFAVLPTLTSIAVIGMCGDHNLDKDTTLESAWFRLEGSGAVVAESDDTTNDEDDIATGVTAVAGTYNTYRIDFTNIADVKFYIDGVAVATAQTFDMSNLTDAEGLLQPYFSLDKTADAGVGTMHIDYVRIWSERTELAINN